MFQEFRDLRNSFAEFIRVVNENPEHKTYIQSINGWNSLIALRTAWVNVNYSAPYDNDCPFFAMKTHHTPLNAMLVGDTDLCNAWKKYINLGLEFRVNRMMQAGEMRDC
jgi:hypothetical protein